MGSCVRDVCCSYAAYNSGSFDPSNCIFAASFAITPTRRVSSSLLSVYPRAASCVLPYSCFAQVELERRLASEEDRRFRGVAVPDTPDTRLDKMSTILAGTHVRSYTKQLHRFAKQASDKLALASRLADE